MDDLTGLDWSSPATANPNKKPPPMGSSSAFYPSLQPSPSPANSGRSTPMSTQGSGSLGAKPLAQKSAQDSFSSLVNFGSSKSNANLSLREQQQRLEAEKRRKEEERRKQAAAGYGDGNFLDTLGQRNTASPRPPAAPAAAPAAAATSSPGKKPADPDEDLFSAFNANTKVDNSSHYPPPPQSRKASPAVGTLDLGHPSAWSKPAKSDSQGSGEDDDPFGLGALKQDANASGTRVQDDEDDFLGDLGRPVEEVRKQRPSPAHAHEPEPRKPIEDSSSDPADEMPPSSNDPFDRAVAQLVGYGFTPENARRGLTESGAGLNVQAAANWLLDDAHRQAKEKANARAGKAPALPERSDTRSSSRSRAHRPDGLAPRDSRSPAFDDSEFAKTAAAMGTSFLKTANALWKTGQKRVQQAVADLQQDGDPSQPRWMRSAQQDTAMGEGELRADVTDEALMLEPRMQPSRPQERTSISPRPSSNASPHDRPPIVSNGPAGRPSAPPKWQQSPGPSLLDPRSRLNKQAIEEQSAQAYVSPARRKKASPQPPPAEALKEQKTAPEPELLSSSTARPKQAPAVPPQPSPRQARSAPPRKAPVARPSRQIPSISPAAIAASTRHRLEGTAHFKRGDYAAAHASYALSLAAVPQSHPVAIVLLCNRALTALKTGEPRQAVADADAALSLIGEGKGAGEAVELGGPDNEKRDMRDLYGKALARKAEALEQMEKWSDAGAVWRVCVESGVGGPAATAGRQRCQNALAPKPAAKPKPSPRPSAPTRPRPPAKAGGGPKSSDAVERLRAANVAAEKEGDEKFALADKVDARVAAWRDGKRDNIRALLGSLDNVLWENSGWKKVGLHELVMANKVKIVYMKAIAKTHPDKLPQDASTEVRMIAGTVFSTLNEAWDKFKAENGL